LLSFNETAFEYNSVEISRQISPKLSIQKQIGKTLTMSQQLASQLFRNTVSISHFEFFHVNTLKNEKAIQT